MMNQAILTGRITKDLELNYTGNGTAVLNFSIAVERPFKNKNGERETDFINLVAFRNTAENINKFFNKGDGIGVIGRIQTGSYENKEGQRVYTTDVIVDQFDFPIQNKQPQQVQKQENPFANAGTDSNPFVEDSNEATILDDDLPF